MRPPTWAPPVELSASEEVIIKRIKRAKLFAFLRLNRLYSDLRIEKKHHLCVLDKTTTTKVC
jgi:hypothetical protein